MTRFSTFCMALFGILLSLDAVGQMTIRGNVLDESSEPLIGATVLVKNTTRGTITDVDGSYELQASQGDVLVFSFTGFSNQEVTVGSSAAISVTLKEGADLSEVVVVGYGSQKKVTVTGAVASLKGKEIVRSPAVDMSNSLAGRLPGLTVIQTSGEPGADGARVSIRGTNTLGNSSPLIVIDGIPDRDGGFGRLNPQDVESISVLKDASAAIYGSRAANGAILVTTKRGYSGKPVIGYSFNQGFAQPTRVPGMSSAVEYANIRNELAIYRTVPENEWSAANQALKTSGSFVSPSSGVTVNSVFSPEAVAKHADGSDPWRYPDTDWFGDAFRTWTPQQRHNLEMSGGSENLTYFSSLGYVFQDAIYKNSATNYKQYNFRTNIDAKISPYVRANLGVMVRREDRNYPTESAGSIFRMLMRGRPTDPEVWPNGKPGPDIENGQNPYVITTNATGYIDSPTDYTQMNGGIDITNPWIKGLKLSLNGAIDKTNEDFKRWQTPWMLYYLIPDSLDANGDPALSPSVRSNFTDPRLLQAKRDVLNTNMTALLSYDFKIGESHNFGLMTGVTREEFKGSNFSAFRRNYISAAIDQLFAGGTVGQETGGSAYERARLGYYGRVQYNYKEKYLAEFIWRKDGSYIFPENQRYGFFPGILLGWNITQEDWFSVNGLDYLKLRASYGEMGNDQVSFDSNGDGIPDLQEYAFLSTYGVGQYPINNVVEATLQETVLANENFTWERAKNINLGLDGNLFGKLDFSLEYFKNRREQILIQETGSTPASSGISTLLPPVNLGKVDNSGFEFNFLYNSNARSDFRWSAGINGGYAKNKVVFMDEVPGIPEYQRQEGKPIGAYLVYESDGAFLNQADIEANNLNYDAVIGVDGTLLPGDMKFKDINGDGKIDADDKTRLDKNATPNFFFGGTFTANYKNFDFSLLFQGALGALFRVQTESGDIGNYLKYDHDNRWSIDNPSSEYPRLASRGDTYYTGGPYGENTHFLFSKDYVRLKNLEIGYTFGNGLSDKIKVRDFRVYFNALNLLTFDKHGVFDPESENQAGTYYPQSRVINFGVSLSF